MSLRVWLPLLGNTDNQGLSDLTFSVTHTNTAVNNNGKIGKCYANSTNNYGGIISDKAIDLGTTVSMACWFKYTSLEASSGLGGSLVSQHCYNDNTGLGITIKYVSATTGYISCSTGTGSSRTFNTYYGTTLLQANTWYHATLTYDGTTIKLYLNGVLEKSVDYAQKNKSNHIGVFAWSINNGAIYGDYKLIGSINDVRIYDHALSAKEVKLLSQGLVCHYTLGDRYASENLIINGFGELGSENWENPSLISTTEIPSTIDTNIKESFYNGNIIKEFIPLWRYNTYTISAYIKATSGAANYSYPSIFPYDVDKNFIATFNCLEGFSSTYKTTLSQPLQKGDTVIHATDLSAWTTGDNYYFHVAIFGYKNSFGYTYPDMEYTQDSPKFGSRTDKSNINKTNNTITLLSAYTGENRPAGTVICQATEGSTYWYPFGGINPSTVPDWTFKTCTFTPNSVNRLRWATYIKYMAYYSVYHAGIKLVDNTDTDRTIYDCSGYNNHATQWAYDTNGSIVNTTLTPRYSFATFINSVVSTGSGAGQASGTRYIYGNCTLKAPDRLTVAFWCNPIKGYGNSTVQGQLSLTNYAIGNNAGVDYQNAPLNHRDNGFDVNSADGTIHRRLSVTFTKGEWHHYAVTYDGRYARMYKDGIETASVDMGSNVALGDMCGIVLGFSKAGGVWRNNQSKYSDFRLYSTCLSADDVKALYQVGASIDKDGNFYAYELKEE